jgi:hypothetical protein
LFSGAVSKDTVSRVWRKSLQKRHGLFDMGSVIGTEQRLRQHDLHQRRVRGQLRVASQRRNGFGGFAGFKQSLALLKTARQLATRAS